MFLHDWFDWSNAGVGVAGLALTVGALAQATGAKRAARQAREAIGHGNAADSLSEMVRFAEQLATWVQCERRAEAIVQVREIVLRIARDRGEFDRFLASDADKLRNVESSRQRLADFLAQVEFPLSIAAKRDSSWIPWR